MSKSKEFTAAATPSRAIRLEAQTRAGFSEVNQTLTLALTPVIADQQLFADFRQECIDEAIHGKTSIRDQFFTFGAGKKLRDAYKAHTIAMAELTAAQRRLDAAGSDYDAHHARNGPNGPDISTLAGNVERAKKGVQDASRQKEEAGEELQNALATARIELQKAYADRLAELKGKDHGAGRQQVLAAIAAAVSPHLQELVRVNIAEDAARVLERNMRVLTRLDESSFE